MKNTILILGSGHLAQSASRKLIEMDYAVAHVSASRFKEREDTQVEESTLDYAKAVLREVGIEQVKAVCILDKADAINLHLFMAVLSFERQIPIIIALLNDGLTEHIDKLSENVHVCNPAQIATSHFVDALERYQEPRMKFFPKEIKIGRFNFKIQSDHLITKLVVAFCCLLFLGTSFFKITEETSWCDSLYLMVTVVTSVNFSDAVINNYDLITRVCRTVLILWSWGFVLITLSFVMDYAIKRHTEGSILGRKRHDLRNHIIVCGLGRFGYPVINALLEQGRRVIVIEQDMDNRYIEDLRYRGVPVLIGDATLPKNLYDVGIERAEGLIATADNDRINLEIGLLARAMKSNLRLILRMYDRGMARQIKQWFGINFAVSTSILAAKHVCHTLTKELKE